MSSSAAWAGRTLAFALHDVVRRRHSVRARTGTQASSIHHLWLLMLWVMIVVFIVTFGSITVALMRGTRRLILGFERPTGYVARWDQIDFSNPRRPTLTCAVDDLRRESLKAGGSKRGRG